MQFILFACLFASAASAFHPQWNSFDGFGMKLAANDHVIASARNDFSQIRLQFSPFDSDNVSEPCTIDYPDLAAGNVSFLYHLAVGRHSNGSVLVAFAGEYYDPANSISQGPFIGRLIGNATSSCAIEANIHPFAPSTTHEEWTVLGVNPSGKVAYSFSRTFGVIYNLLTGTIVNSWHSSNTFWPNSSYFLPHAIDISSTDYAVVAGFAKESVTGSFRLVIHLLRVNNTSAHVVDTWAYPLSNASSRNWDAESFHSKYIMSVSINEAANHVLVGVPSMNTVFRFEVNVTSDRLSYVSSLSNGNYLGLGKSVAWLDDGEAMVILANKYSLQYEWISSSVSLYNGSDVAMTSPHRIFPNEHMPAWDGLDATLVTMVSTPMHVVVLDNDGQVYVIRSAPAGFYSLTSVAVGENPAFSSVRACPPGTYKIEHGFDLCTLCPVGTSTPSFSWSTACVHYTCDNASFCPIGSIVNDTYAMEMIDINQVVAYPSAPDTTVYDDILMEHIFTVGHVGCLHVSPLFWALLLAGIATLIMITMGILKYSKRSVKLRSTVKRVFRQIDLIEHGESWVTGMASLSLMVILAIAYYFSYSFLNEYPTEKVSDATFTCDAELRNAKFVTSIQPLMIPRDEEYEPVFELLQEQELVLIVDFVNTMLDCSHIEVQEYLHSIYHPVEINCTRDSHQYITSVALEIVKHSGQFQYVLDDIYPIGGLRLRLTGAAHDFVKEHHYAVQKIEYMQSIHRYGETLAHNPTLKLEFTRVINLTEPLAVGGQHEFSGLWVPTVVSQAGDLFHKPAEAQAYALSTTTLTLLLSESSTYVWNQEMPIARPTEIVFHDLLFTIVCFELFGLGYMIGKLIFFPLFKLFRRRIEKMHFIRTKLGHHHHHGAVVQVKPIEEHADTLASNVDHKTKTSPLPTSEAP